jgi:hypothetical protein
MDLPCTADAFFSELLSNRCQSPRLTLSDFAQNLISFLCRFNSEIAVGQARDSKYKYVKRQHVHPAAWNFVHWHPRYASTIMYRYIALQLLYRWQYQSRNLWIPLVPGERHLYNHSCKNLKFFIILNIGLCILLRVYQSNIGITSVRNKVFLVLDFIVEVIPIFDWWFIMINVFPLTRLHNDLKNKKRPNVRVSFFSGIFSCVTIRFDSYSYTLCPARWYVDESCFTRKQSYEWKWRKCSNGFTVVWWNM